MNKRLKKGTALFHHRDSAGRSEVAPSAYVEQVARLCHEQGLTFTGTVAQIKEMIASGVSIRGDIYLDYGVKGNRLDRPGLNGIKERIASDLSVSHIMIASTDRLARPDDLFEALYLERTIVATGVTLFYFLDQEVIELNVNSPDEQFMHLIQRSLAMLRASKARSDHSKKITSAQVQNAKEGHANGGRPPYGFRSFFVHPNGSVISQLAELDVSQLRSHRVVWLPGDETELNVVRRIFWDVRRLKSPRQIAMELTREGILTPSQAYAARRGVEYHGSKRWSHQTICQIVRNLLYQGVVEFGRRSTGEASRFSLQGPRPLTDADRDGTRPITVTNPIDQRSRVPGNFPPVVPPHEQDEAIAILNRRARPRKGDATSKNLCGPRRTWIFDAACTWPMYHYEDRRGPRYRCGLYEGAGGEVCEHNTIDGKLAHQFALSVVQQQVAQAGCLGRLESTIDGLLQQAQAKPKTASMALKNAESDLNRAEKNLKKAALNLALAEDDPEERLDLARVRRELRQQRDEAAALVDRLTLEASPRMATESTAEQVRAFIARLPELVAQTRKLEAAKELVRLLNIRLYLQFQKRAKTRRDGTPGRALNKLSRGIVAVGKAAAPFEVYSGGTSREAIRQAYGLDDPKKPRNSPGDDPGWLGKGNHGVPRNPATHPLFVRQDD